ncbi:MAG TPA: GGDEF domain-containing protein [Ramlibacter sp.]|uniref:GGDEF domain-containing protein n=1 Tax=Ramlibacter sp. TaxID=1917967 RepID=UPI002D285550|nr:GGDEF domain-containing protein [Ramlibacter sp.]HZY18681.1 GGDEF domain-containing protein [Ramlibacter sp.]
MDNDFAPTSIEPWQVPAGCGADGAAREAGGLRRLLGRMRLARRNPQLDVLTPLLSREGLIAQGERLLSHGRYRADGAALVLFDFADLLEVRDIYGERVSKALLAKLASALRRLAGRHGLAARTGPAQFAVLLPGLPRQAAVDATLRVLGTPCRIEFDAAGFDLVLVPDVSVDTCDAQSGSLEALYNRLSVALARYRDHEERRRSHLRRSRERHSRPMPLEPETQSAPASLPAA